MYTGCHGRRDQISHKKIPVNLQDYIATGILEKYVLGLATPQETTEVDRLRRFSPELAAELTATEQRIERLMVDIAVQPPAGVYSSIVQRLAWEDTLHADPTNTTNTPPAYTLITGKTMTISIWWRCAFAVAVVLAIAFAVSTLYFYERARAMEQFLWQR